VLQTITDELNDYSFLYASQQLTQQEVDGYNDPLDLYREGYDTAKDLLGLPEEHQRKRHYSVEGMNYSLIAEDVAEDGQQQEPTSAGPVITLAAAGEAAINGIALQAVADSATLQDDYGE